MLIERYAPWRVLLPRGDGSVLAVALGKTDLAALGRSWKTVCHYACDGADVAWALEQANADSQTCKFRGLDNLGSLKLGFEAVAISAETANGVRPEALLELVRPGGAVAWIGSLRHVPSTAYLSRTGYCHVRRYAALPPASGKITLPISRPHAALSGLALYHPGQLGNRMAILGARCVSALGFQHLLGWRQVVVAREPGLPVKDAYLSPWIIQRTGLPVSEVAIHVHGTTPEEARGPSKITLQLLNRDGSVLGFAKVADTPLAQSALDRETETLQRLAAIEGLRDAVPKVLATGDWHGHAIQVQTAPDRGRMVSPKRLTALHLDFLARLTQVSRHEVPLRMWPGRPQLLQWVNDSSPGADIEQRILRRALSRCTEVLAEAVLPVHRAHGDFARSNILVGKNRLFVVDWEESHPEGLPFLDLMHFAYRRLQNSRGAELSYDHLFDNPQDALGVRKEIDWLMRVCPGLRLLGQNRDKLEALLTLCLLADVMKDAMERSPLFDEAERLEVLR